MLSLALAVAIPRLLGTTETSHRTMGKPSGVCWLTAKYPASSVSALNVKSLRLTKIYSFLQSLRRVLSLEWSSEHTSIFHFHFQFSNTLCPQSQETVSKILVWPAPWLDREHWSLERVSDSMTWPQSRNQLAQSKGQSPSTGNESTQPELTSRLFSFSIAPSQM